MLTKQTVLELFRDTMWPAFTAERTRLDRLDRWYRWDHDKPHSPRTSTREYKQLAERSVTPWLGFVVTAVAQNLYVDGYRDATSRDNAPQWDYWQANGLDGRQVAIHRAALAYGLAYTTVLPGESDQGEAIPVIRGVSPRRMMAFYLDPAEDDWPAYALRADPAKVDGSLGWSVRVYDDEVVHRLLVGSSGDRPTYVTFDEHGVGVCPVVRYASQLDLEGRSSGEVEPFIPIAARIDQTTFDRLVVQRFSSWVVRTIAGMTQPAGGTEAAAAEKLRLQVEDILVSTDKDTKFGSLPATPLDGFISAKDADIRDLSAVTQTPPSYLLGQMVNLSAEALAGAEAALFRKIGERQHSFGESHEQTLRLGSTVMGDEAGARATGAQVRWRDTEARSLAQTADALGKLATMLQIPVEMLWEKVPGWTDQDVERARDLVADRPPAPVPTPAP